MMDLPTFNNSPLMLIKLAPGVEASNNRRYNGVNALGGTAEAHNVGNVGGNDWSIDGVPNIGNGYSAAYLPYSTTIQEYKVETANFDAEFGHTSGVSIAIMTKSGTNAYHGDADLAVLESAVERHAFLCQAALLPKHRAAEASGNHALAEQLRNSPQQPSGHSNDYGASLGGPIRIPHLIDGRNKLFFFFSFDGFDDRKPTENTFNHTVPTLAERQGDFSDLLAVNAAKYQLYDPLTVHAGPEPARPLHSRPVRRQYHPENRIINPDLQHVSSILRAQQFTSHPALEPLNNYVVRGSRTTGSTRHSQTASTISTRRNIGSSVAGRG